MEPSDSPLWQERAAERQPGRVKHGVEAPFNGTVESLVESSASVTLLTLAGHEVQVRAIQRIGEGWWDGEVLRSVQAPGAPRVGTVVAFAVEHVQAATSAA